MREALGEVISASPVLEEFAQVWERIGLSTSQRQVRRETMGVHICNLLKEILQEEEELEKSMIKSLQTNEAELADLCSKLGLPVEQVSPFQVQLQSITVLSISLWKANLCMKGRNTPEAELMPSTRFGKKLAFLHYDSLCPVGQI